LHTLFSLESTIAHSLSGEWRDEARPEWNGKSYEKDFDSHLAAHLDRNGFSGERVEDAGSDVSSVDAKWQVELNSSPALKFRGGSPDSLTPLPIYVSTAMMGHENDSHKINSVEMSVILRPAHHALTSLSNNANPSQTGACPSPKPYWPLFLIA
jgi:hypothetical protein